MTFSIEFSRRAEKDLNNLDKVVAGRCLAEIEMLKENPFPRGAVKVKGEEGVFRVRVGKYRILYEVYSETNVVLITKIDKRGRVYE
ncbi:MAG: type II toxin-antitoxin system RelE/ParE family toxin [Candidatus Aenigmatarchaeota archaeon]